MTNNGDRLLKSKKILVGINLTQIQLAEGMETYPLREANIYVRKQEIAVVEGWAGSGKTALLNVIAGFESLKRGEIVISGQSLSKINNEEAMKLWRLRYVTFISDDYYYMKDSTVLLNVELPLLLLKIPRKRRYRQVTYALEAFGLLDIAKKKAAQLSPLEILALCCARSLASDPAIMLIDDPLTNLPRMFDIVETKEVLDATKQILMTLKQLERTVLITARDDTPHEPRNRTFRQLYGKLISV